MSNPYFILYEITLYLQLAFCLPHAWKHGTGNLLRLLAGILFGVSLELATIRQLQAYEYGQFIIMVLDVPLGIGVAWGCILYSVMEFSDASSLPYFLRPVLDGLLALNIDLSLDAVAIRFGFWDWGQGLNFQYFGVPYANFWAWFWVIFFFSFGYRLFARRRDWVGTWISPVIGLVIGLLGVLGTNTLIAFVVPAEYRGLVVVITLCLALIFIVAQRPKFYLTPVPSLAFWVPFITHIYVLIAGLISGLILDPPFLLLVGLVMIVIALYLHWPTIRLIFNPRVKPIRNPSQ
ncbi:MAG: carotenoid biosynthesis protein [Anaerolineae bacterium]|nr:carotenoid biosynthesis protein [Anaerolineae bacterium]